MSAKEQTDTPRLEDKLMAALREIDSKSGADNVLDQLEKANAVGREIWQEAQDTIDRQAAELTALKSDVRRLVDKYQAAVDDANRSIKNAVENRVPQEYVNRHKERRDKAEEVVRDFKSLLKPTTPA